ncbi:hypothetical protein MMYC01_208887 [Madurella mycetomatis]|uniref:Uncharacterized protein n=1 Tax=Madurella mycetomatis TaxID=100816 RepID=A0A175VSY2_9PEZI|nr:hypothetical protein MMYC01_208887 [Madurella mycetomatis]
MPPKNASPCVNMDSEKRTEVLHDLDLKYRNSIHECNLLIKDEEARRIRLRSMLHRDEASSLRDLLAQKDVRVKELVDQVDDIRGQLDSAREKSRRQDNLMRTQSREIANLKDELSAFNAVSQDSSKILSEKLALSREVALLKPELEHLRSQLAHQKDVLAEKLALERQLNTLEVELANEKRAAQKAAQKQEHGTQDEEDLRKQVRELEKELAKAKRLAEKYAKEEESKNSEAQEELESLREQLAAVEESLAAEKRKAEQAAKARSGAASEMQEEMEQLRWSLEEAEKALAAEKRAGQRQAKSQANGSSAADGELAQLREELAEVRQALAAEKKEQEKLRKLSEQAQTDAEDRQQALSDKAGKLRSKLRETREELANCRAELEKAQERTDKAPNVPTTTVPLKKPGAKANAKKKRTADDMSIDDKVLLTPGNMDDRPKRLPKKRGIDLSMVTEKSTFSITPFLNKTVNLNDASPKPTGDDATPVPQSRSATTTADSDPTTTTTTTEEPAAPEPSATKSAAAGNAAVEKKPRGRPHTKPLTDSSPSKKNLTARPPRKAPRAEHTLEKVDEEPDGDSNDSAGQDQENRTVDNSATTTLTDKADKPAAPELKKKKRKLLGSNTSTLFDNDDEGERVKASSSVAAAASVTSSSSSKSAKTGEAGGSKPLGKTVAGRAVMGGAKNAFGAGKTFSPLKRDRRGLGLAF